MSIPPKKPRIVAVVGPTASGKSALAIELARRFKGEIVSADSRQVYRGMDVGTGKVTKREMRGVPHHLLDVASPRATFTVAQYQKLGRAAIKKILKRGKLPIIVGGTGFYVDSLIYDYDLPHVKPNAALRRKLEKLNADALFAKLERLDPRRAATIDRYNKRRLVRALEIVLVTKRPVPAMSDSLKRNSDYDVLLLGINPGPKRLAENIHKRLFERIRKGMIKEVRTLHDKTGLSWQRLDNFGLEYRYVSRYLRGVLTKDAMLIELEKEIRHYAKRQMTWFKKNENIRWIEQSKEAARLVQKFLK
jgi:tRNA dimethylallyltransferase